jgi:drug/metabolite transporter (DMT)-like permease
MREKWLIIGAFAAIYIIWGSTYLANALAITEIPPFLMAGTRFLVAGLLLYGLMTIQGKEQPTLKQWRNGTLMGVLFLSIGNGALVKALQYVDSGMAALIIAFDPLIIIMMMWALVGIRPGRRNVFGTFLGIIGMAILVGQPNFMSSRDNQIGLLLITVSMFSWAFASIYISRIELPKAKGMGSAVQMITGGIIMIIFSGITSEFSELNIQEITMKGWFSWGYLVVFGSIIGFSSFNYLLHKVSPDKVSTSTFINPIVALFLGWMFNKEYITSQSLIAAVILLSGVVFINAHKIVSKKETID